MWTLCGQNQVGSVSGFFRGSDQDTDPFLSRKPDQDQFHPDPQPFIQRLPFLSIMFHSLSRIRRINLVCACEANNKCPRKTENLICLNWLDCSRHSYSCWNQVDQFLIDKLIVVPKIQKVKSSSYLRSWFFYQPWPYTVIKCPCYWENKTYIWTPCICTTWKILLIIRSPHL